MFSLDHLKTFSEFIKSGSMSAAAKKLGISQPAVSMQLRALEDSSPHPLFLMEGTRKILSPYGRQLFENVDPVLDQMNHTIQNLMLKNQSEKITLAGREAVLENLLSRIKKFPGPFELVHCSSAEAVQKVTQHEVSFAIGYNIPQASGLIAKKIYRSYPVLAFSSADFPQFKKKNFDDLTTEDLRSVPILTHRKEDPLLAQICRMKGLSVSSLNFGVVASNWSVIRQAALQGQGIAFLPSEYVLNFKDLSVIQLEDAELPKFEYHLIYPRHISKSVLGRKWIDLILDLKF